MDEVNASDQTGGNSIISSLRSALVTASRSFLGLPAVGHPQGPQNPYEDANKRVTWVWEDETFPRLRLKDGTVMPGDVSVENWSCPEWKDVEEVPLI